LHSINIKSLKLQKKRSSKLATCLAASDRQQHPPIELKYQQHQSAF